MCYSFYCITQGQVGLYIKTVGEKSQMNLVKVMESGEYFGTYNLIQNSPQTMQSTCESLQVYLIEISKEFFDKHLKENEEKIIASGINQFKKMSLFKSHPYYLLKNIYLSSFEVKLVKNNYVFKENDDIHAIYVIKKGDFSIYKSFDWDQKQTNQIYLKKASYFKQVKLSVMVEGQIFGEEDLVQGRQNRSYTAICDSSEGQLYVIRSQIFLQKIYNNNFSKKTILELLKQKNTLFKERMEIIQKQYIEKQSPQYCKTQPDKDDGEKTVQAINPMLVFKESSEQNVTEQYRVQTATSSMSRTSRGQFYSPVKVSGEYEKIMERRMSPFKQLENSLLGNKEDLVYENKNLDHKMQKIMGSLASPSQQTPPKPQTDMFSIEIDEKQKILLKQKQQQYYQYKNYLKNFESDKLNELLKKSGYKRIDKNTVEKKQGNEYDFIKIRPAIKLKSLDQNFSYFYGPEQQLIFNNCSNGALSNTSSKYRVSSYNDQFQIKLQQNTSLDELTTDYVQYQNQLQNKQEDTMTNFNEDLQHNNEYQLQQMYSSNLINNQSMTNSQLQNKSSHNYCRFQAQRGQIIKQELGDLDNTNMVLEIDPNYDGEIQINSLFQNDALKNKNIAPDQNQNYIITEIEEEDRVSTQQSNQRKLKTESLSSNFQQDYLFQQSTRQNTLSPARGEKSLLLDNFENIFTYKDESYLFNQKGQYSNKSETQCYINDNQNNQAINPINLNRSFNTVDNNQILKQKQNNYSYRSQSTRKQRSPLKKNFYKQIEPIYNKEYLNQQLKKFTLSNNNSNQYQNEDYLVPNLTDSFRKYNAYKLPSMSQGQSRKNSPPLSPQLKTKDEQRLFSFKQDLKKNVFLKLHLNSYEQNLNSETYSAITVKKFQKVKNNLN